MIGLIVFVLIFIAVLIILFSVMGWYVVVTPDEAHLVVGPKMKKIFTSNQDIIENKQIVEKYGKVKSWYFNIPFVRSRRIIDFKPRELKERMRTVEKAMGRFYVQYSLKYKINNVEKAVTSFIDYSSLEEMLQEVVQNAVRVVTVKKTIQDCISKKSEIADEVGKEIIDDLNQWGLVLVTFQLTDFEDTEESDIVSKLSEGREAEVRAQTAEIVADRDKQARIKVAEAEELAKKRELEKDEKIGIREQEKNQEISIKQKDATEKEYDVKKVQAVRQAEIDKEKALVDANKEKEVQEIAKEQNRLKGEGERLYLEEKAKGDASSIRESGFAEAEAKEKLKEALKFDDNAIRALIAEKIVEAQRAIGVEGAKALANAEMKIFAGSDNGGGFDVGKMIESTNIANTGTAKAMLKKLGIPNNLGFDGLDLSSLDEKFKGGYVPEKTPEPKPEPVKEEKNISEDNLAKEQQNTAKPSTEEEGHPRKKGKVFRRDR